ncbi:MAG: ribonuclease H [Bacteroidetes bacterium ADurb.Bin145]|jgi:ribonuclease HI|nr:MAG: ribonuclease H [Bacteroidetes bacterium ADurb.Bin145]
MLIKDHRAIYIHCDGSMMPNTKSSGGIGYIIKFPDEFELEDISDIEGTFEDANIERLEILALIKGMQGFIDWISKSHFNLTTVSKIVLITDRFDLQDNERTNPYKISEWRKHAGKNFEGKEILNWDLLNELDKTRNKLRKLTWKTVRIEYIRRKFNKEADKLSKKAREIGIPNKMIAIIGHKIGRRKFDGQEVDYRKINPHETINIHVFRKRPIKEQWEVNAEILSGDSIGRRIKIITDYTLQEKLNRGNLFIVKIKAVYTYHVEIFRTIKKVKK